MTVSLEESVKGAEKRVRLPTGKELNVKIPAGVSSGQQIRLKGQGESAPGHRPGDLLITITIATARRSSRSTAAICGSNCRSRCMRRCWAPRCGCRR